MTNTRPQRIALVTALLAATVVASGTQSASAQFDGLYPDDGLPAVSVDASPLVSTRTEVLQAGVVGENQLNDSFPNTEATVTAFAEIGDRMYVGGKFTQVEIAATGVRHDQSFLAAFDRTTGAWINSFGPVINGNVWDLKATPDGNLVVAGQFTNVNGVPNTAGVAMVEPVNGAVVPTWRANLTLTGGGDQYPLARTLDIDDGYLYIGGNFTRLTGTDGITKMTGRIARVDLATGNADGSWLPNLDGIIFDIDANGDRVHVAGNFFNVNDEFRVGQVTLRSSNGAILPGQLPFERTSTNRVDRSYQQTILAVGDDVWLGGSEHNRQVYNRSDFSLIRSWVSMPFGDAQALAHLNGVVYSGSHAGGNGFDTFLYADTTDYPGVADASGSQPIRYMAAFDTTTHQQIPWIPQIGTSNGEGSWELFADSTNCLWSGGDFDRGSFDGDVARYVQGFAKFCATDTVAPAAPTNPTAVATSSGINLAWTASTGDDRGGEVRYEILKNDSVFASFISINTFRDPDGTATDRYFVRAMDYTGNRSASTRVFTAAGNDTTRPSTPTALVGVVQPDGTVQLDWTASTDNVAVTEYIVFRNGVEFARSAQPTVVATNAIGGLNYYQVRAIDAAGNESFKTPSTIVTIATPDTTRPSTPTNLAGTQNGADVTLTWTASTDDVAVTEYVVLRNGTEIARVASPAVTIGQATPGTNYFQIRALDAAGNESFKTSPLVFEVTGGPDTTRPSTPTALVGVVQPDGTVQLDWTASTDNVAVTEYIVFRNGVEFARPTGTTAVATNAIGGLNYYQVRAIDAAGNESFKTPSTIVTIVEPDTTAPRTPTNLVGTIQPDGSVQLDWTAPTDNVGVTGYIVFRNGVEFARPTGTTTIATNAVTGLNYYQVRAFDAAGNESFKTPSTIVTIDA